MKADQNPYKRIKRVPNPLDSARLEGLALAYVARFSTSAAKLERYLKRKLQERGWDDEAGNQPDLDVIVARYVALGYVDDEAYAKAKAGGLLRRGYGLRRIGQALGEAGIDADLRDQMRPSEHAQRRAALLMARKRRFGPFGAALPDRAAREKQIAALLRAGHGYDSAAALVDARSAKAAEAWAQAAEDAAMDDEEF